MITRFELAITYSQLAVFDPDLEDPFNDWHDIHVAQGFTWRSNTVSFGTLVDIGRLVVEIWRVTAFELCPLSTRAIVVPFTVPSSGKVGVSDMAEEGTAILPPGPYALVFETGFLTDNPEDGTWVRLSFVPQESVEPAILRADVGLNPPEILDMQADPV